LGCIAVLLSYAQAPTDTLHLAQITVTTAELNKYIPGGQHLLITTDSLPVTMAQGIGAGVPVYFVQYGAPGQLASINLRGLGAARTSVHWQGMEINSFTLGQSDFGQMSMASSDVMEIQFGGVGAMYGNGALGGTIDLRSQLDYQRGHSLKFNSQVGSFGSLGTAINYRYSGGRISSSTRVFHQQATNDFEYLARNGPQTQQNAAFNLNGIVQDLEYRLNEANSISLHFWLNHHFREIQPNINDPDNDEVLKTRNTRGLLRWQNYKGNWYSKVQVGFSDDYQLYDRQQLTRLYRGFASFDAEWSGYQGMVMRFGGNLNYLDPEVDAYDDQVDQTRSELYAALEWSRIKNLNLGFIIRTPMVDGNFKALSPLVSAAYTLYNSSDLTVTADFQASNSFRLPTMNDFYWVPGGNPNLKPEQSTNLEAGIAAGWKIEKISLNTNLRAFRHAVDNWIIWLPGGNAQTDEGETISFWYPENIREVLATGLEYRQSISWKPPTSDFTTTVEINGTYNKSLNKKTLSPVDRSRDKQLPYTPVHLINSHWKNSYKTWSLNLSNQYSSQRFVEANNELPPLSEYFLWNAGLGKSGSIGAWKWLLQFSVNNVFDRDYQTYENRAIPGRNYQLNLTINYN